MKYEQHYARLIERARVRELRGYRERHHILPRCMGGNDSPDNLVFLTAEEHYVAHQLLVKINPHVPGLAWAAVKMAQQCTGNKAYAWLRLRHAANAAEQLRGNKRTLGYRHSAETKARIAEAIRRRGISAEVRAKMAASATGKKRTAEQRARMSMAQRGKKMPPRTDEHRARLSAVLKGRRIALGSKRTAEQKERMSLAARKRGTKPRSQEGNAKQAASMRLYWERRKAEVLTALRGI